MTKIDSLFCLEKWMEVSNYKCQNCQNGEIGCAIHGSPSVPFWQKLKVNFSKSFAIERFSEIRGIYTNPENWRNVENEIVAFPGSILPFPAPQKFNQIHDFLHFT